ncbi:MAG: HPr family phosphocarrier protein [Verrucomicrobia bacterium]|nr:HPr family phosphocarrier protein [Verrucomicrobiota bacterium]
MQTWTESGAIQVTLKIVNTYGICARPAALFAKLANRFDSEITVARDDNVVSGKSIMGLLVLEASLGTTITITARGHDAAPALAELADLVNGGFYM